MILNKQNYLIIPKHILCEIRKTQTNSYVWFSGNFGTIFYKIPFGYNAIKKKNIIFFFPINFSAISCNYNINFCCHFQKIHLLLTYFQKFIISSSYGFKRFLKIRGRGYRYFLNQQKQIEISTELSHNFKIIPWSQLLFKISTKGKKIKFRLKSLLILRNFLVELRKKKLPNYITGKGIRYIKDRAQKRVLLIKRF